VLRAVIDTNADLTRETERNICMRGLGYRSQFVRDLTFCPDVVSLLSRLSREELWPHDVLMHLGHVNFGEAGSGKAVDHWHTDATDYVFVLILSDCTDMEGGELQVLQLADASGRAFDEIKVQGIRREQLETVKYPGPGHCIFMQGARILHSVTPVTAARETRVSFVNSYGRRDVFAQDRTSFSSMAHSRDPEEIYTLEFTRHRAWRVQGQLQVCCVQWADLNW
jgi:hypothetical protein